MSTQHWSYSGSTGPSHWAALAPAAAGQRQSPIAIRAADAHYSQSLRDRPLVISYRPDSVNKITNNGHSVQIVVDGTDCCLQGGPLDDDAYLLVQFHFHWGSDSSHGSEHRIDGNAYAAELHLVHWNTTRFGSFNDAVKTDKGLCVLTVFLEAGDTHMGIEKLCRLLPSVKYSGQSATIPDGFQPDVLLPEDRSMYWTYEGSLTTPPCYESARFIIFKQPIQVSENQLSAFRGLRSCDSGHETSAAQGAASQLVNNYRPTMPLNGRVVTATFRKFFA